MNVLSVLSVHLELQQMDFEGVSSNGHFFEVKVFNPYVPSNQKTPLSACYCSHENEK